MRVRHLKSSGVVIEDNDVKVLCDPWLLDGAFYGSWAHYPPLDFEPEDLNDVDYIYVSHIHPDHCHLESLERMDKEIPVLIHDYEWDFLLANIERLGFSVTELPHNERVHLKDDLHINILASDNCNPEACGNYFGCSWYMEDAGGGRSNGSTQIDSMGVFDNGEHTVVNANDCRWPMTEQAGLAVKAQYGDIDMLLMQYAAANFYPQCMGDYTAEERKVAAEEVIEEMYKDAEAFVNLFEPRYFMPFAGSYTLSGSLAELNEYLAVPERQEAYEHFSTSDNIDSDRPECVLLNSGEYLDLETGTPSAEYRPIDPEEKQRYIDEVLANREFTFESDPWPTLETFKSLVPEAYESFDEKRESIGFSTDTTVLLELVEDTYAKISMKGEGYDFIGEEEADEVDGYVKMTIDPRLLKRILEGPQYAHFNNAQIGSHIRFEKEPDIYERPLYYSMSFFHA